MSDVEVWQVELAAGEAGWAEALLSADERERAARLTRPEPWIVARAALRTVLGARLGVPAAEVEFAAGPHGKPELPGARLRFNLSHSGERALIALADGVEVGVDVERTARSSRAVERTLTDGERAALPGGRPPRRAAARLVPQGGAGQGDRRRARLGARELRHELPGRLRAGRPRARRGLHAARWPSRASGRRSRCAGSDSARDRERDDAGRRPRPRRPRPRPARSSRGERANGSTGTTSLSPMLESVVKLRNSSSIHVRSASGSTAAMKLPGSIAWQTTNT